MVDKTEKRLEKLEKAIMPAEDTTITVRLLWKGEKPTPGPGVIVVGWPDDDSED